MYDLIELSHDSWPWGTGNHGNVGTKMGTETGTGTGTGTETGKVLVKYRQNVAH